MLVELETSRFRRTAKWHVWRVLKWINQEDLKDLHAIKIIDDRSNDPEYVKRPRYLSGFLYNGHYEFKTKDRQARVVLYANDIFFGIPYIMMHTPVATLKVASTLAHEIGHHVVATKGYIYKPWEKYRPWNGVNDPCEEKMVELYAADVIERMARHWRYKFGKFLAGKLANFLYDAGRQEYWDGDYVRSAKLAFHAYHLDPTNLAANQCYRHAMEKLKTQTPSPLNDSESDWLLHGYDGNPQATLQKWRLSQAIEKRRRKKKHR
ncbi:MAG TPA: hypothetical protein VFD62_06380 [Pyrinomonadaceae bacterium]|nr:hypothetical protein [Pyrinomonadaceae bacterium]